MRKKKKREESERSKAEVDGRRSKVSSTLTGQTVSVISRVRSLRKRNTGPDEKDVRKEAAATLP